MARATFHPQEVKSKSNLHIEKGLQNTQRKEKVLGRKTERTKDIRLEQQGRPLPKVNMANSQRERQSLNGSLIGLGKMLGT